MIVIDYVATCEKRGEMLNFAEFVRIWLTANDLADNHPDLREEVILFVLVARA